MCWMSLASCRKFFPEALSWEPLLFKEHCLDGSHFLQELVLKTAGIFSGWGGRRSELKWSHQGCDQRGPRNRVSRAYHAKDCSPAHLSGSLAWWQIKGQLPEMCSGIGDWTEKNTGQCLSCNGSLVAVAFALLLSLIKFYICQNIMWGWQEYNNIINTTI